MKKLTLPGFGLTLIILLLVVSAFTQLHKPMPHSSQPDVQMAVLDPSLEMFAPAWQTEISRRFHNVVAVLVHGGDFVKGQWIVEGPYESGGHVLIVTDVVDEIHQRFPDRNVILLACNTGHIEIHNRPWLYYAKSSVWCIPDRATGLGEFDMTRIDGKVTPFEFGENRWQSDPDIVGNVYEFVQG